MTQRIHVTVEVDTDELRRWADHHADRGHHGVAHVLYKAASDGESLSEQTIRAAVIEEGERIARAIEARYLGADFGRQYDGRESPDALLHHAYDEGLQAAVEIARADRNPNGGDS